MVFFKIDDYNLHRYLLMCMDDYNLRWVSIDDYNLHGYLLTIIYDYNLYRYLSMIIIYMYTY